MNLKEVMNLYSLHSKPEELAGYEQQQQAMGAHRGKCAHLIDYDNDVEVKILEGGLVECLMQVLDDDTPSDTSVYPYTGEKIEEILLPHKTAGKNEQQVQDGIKVYMDQVRKNHSISDEDFNQLVSATIERVLENYRSGKKKMNVFNSINPKTLIVEDLGEFNNIIALTQPIELVQRALDQIGRR